MKNTIYKLLMLTTAVVACITTGCKKDKELEHTNVSMVNTLFAPENNKFVKLDPKAGTQVFEWQQAQAEDGGLVFYEVVFDKENGDFSQPIFSVASDDKGTRNKLTISDADLNKIANMAGIKSLETGKLKWAVWSSKGINVQKSTTSRLVQVERPKGFAELPADLYLTGSATEGGADLTKALRFKKTGSATYEIYTSLKAGTYHFAAATNASAKSYSIANNDLVEGGDVTVAGDTKVYRIKLDFENITYSVTEITSLGLWFSAENKVLHTLTYTGGGVWSISNAPIVFHQETWGRDERYKFRMGVKNAAGTAGTEWYGSSNRDNSRADANSAASYFYLLPVDGSQYDYSYKFNGAADNKNVDITVSFAPTGTYTHSITVK
ncbi:SusE domain-containing protein [Mucilaginibacter lacusdianchii]|uniref:SusE domain-containing protein n=1 Tax=Mucilaginibacter lacusdianchii TaxID=2684211 RepID=UPI00131E035B|nr:SusE domain-containing protein [Mucilaginibacter sp. JXJ CY 39]